MPKSFLFTNKRFTSYKNNGTEKSLDIFEEAQYTTPLHNAIEYSNNVDRTEDGLMDMSKATSNENSINLSSTVPHDVRKEHTLPIIKQKERYRMFETSDFNKPTLQPHVYHSFETSKDVFEYDNTRNNFNYQSLVPETYSTPVKHCDASDGESDSGISFLSEDSRPGFSPKNDYAYHCSEHLSLLFDFFSPRKPIVRETLIEERPERRVLDFSMPSYPSVAPGNSEPQDFSSGSTTEEEFICDDCGKRYSTSSNLARHRQTHRSSGDKKARQCPHCEKVYVSMPAFSMHVRTHNQGCECQFCGKKFSRPWLLQGHIRTHTGEKPFSCPQCSKCFADKSNLRAHVQTHSTEKPYVCGRCGKAFALKSYLYKHEESSCMRGQRSSQKGARNGIAVNQPSKVLFVDEQRSSW